MIPAARESRYRWSIHRARPMPKSTRTRWPCVTRAEFKRTGGSLVHRAMADHGATGSPAHTPHPIQPRAQRTQRLPNPANPRVLRHQTPTDLPASQTRRSLTNPTAQPIPHPTPRRPLTAPHLLPSAMKTEFVAMKCTTAPLPPQTPAPNAPALSAPNSPSSRRRRLAIPASVACTASNACPDCIAGNDINAGTRHPRPRLILRPQQPDPIPASPESLP